MMLLSYEEHLNEIIRLSQSYNLEIDELKNDIRTLLQLGSEVSMHHEFCVWEDECECRNIKLRRKINELKEKYGAPKAQEY